jgi:hypothetical protein
MQSGCHRFLAELLDLPIQVAGLRRTVEDRRGEFVPNP